ncbi:MAG: DNA adenine methylase [Treponema sp.]|nr:DNA adenine methylase [Treponema sp.]
MDDIPCAESKAFLSRQLITYIGNKRSLLPFIGNTLAAVKKRLGRQKLTIFDAFSGSGATARYFKAHAELLLVNDIEAYSQAINRCYLANAGELPINELKEIHGALLHRLNEEPLRKGFIADLYAPQNEEHINFGERVFYTPRNAMFIDTARQHIEAVDPALRHFFIAPLLSEASVHANTAGVFKGFYKDRHTGKGRFGGTGRNALARIKGDIELPFPLWSKFNCPVKIFCQDANALVSCLEETDLAYFDPPYNQHPYGSNYFMLNLILSYERPRAVSAVSGIPPDWNRSAYNKRQKAAQAFCELIEKTRAKYILVSFNSEGFISPGEMRIMLEKAGKVEVFETPYNTFRGSRNLRSRQVHVREYLFLLEKF